MLVTTNTTLKTCNCSQYKYGFFAEIDKQIYDFDLMLENVTKK